MKMPLIFPWKNKGLNLIELTVNFVTEIQLKNTYELLWNSKFVFLRKKSVIFQEGMVDPQSDSTPLTA